MANTFALLGDLDEEGDDGWQEVTTKKKQRPAASPPASTSQQFATPRSAPTTTLATRAAISSAQTSAIRLSTARLAPPQPQPAPRPSAPPPRVQTHDESGKPLGQEYYKAFQRAYRTDKGDVAFRFHKTDIVVVRANGDVVLTTGGYTTYTTFLSINDALAFINFRLRSNGEITRGDWTVVDNGNVSYPYHDGVVIPAKTSADRNRAESLLLGWQEDRRSERVVGGVPMASPGGRSSRQTAAPPAPFNLAQEQLQQLQQQQRQQRQQQAAAAASARALAPGQPAQPSARMSPPQVSPRQPVVAPPPPLVPPGPSAPPPPSALNPRESRGHEAALSAKLFEVLALQGDDALDDDHACIVCMAALRDTIVIPCGHLVLCSACHQSMAQKGSFECPMCRVPVTDHLTVEG